ncbi:MAG TPA: DUF885 domain-containing protein [Candidatus Limnocylindria bacterium]|nr:DUF885 domain-containing protein [Candidatus Limnocylindria bacterium]
MNDPAVAAWLDDFFAAYYRRRPVNATFIGVHEHDATLPNLSERAVEETLGEIEGLLRRLRTLPGGAPGSAQAIDRALADGFLEIQRWEYGSTHFHRGNPSFYTGEAIFSVLSLFLARSAPLAERVAAATSRMRAFPELLAQAKANVRAAPAAWTERALRECVGAIAFLTGGVEALGRDERVGTQGFAEAARAAAAAFEDLRSHLTNELMPHDTGRYACGAEAFALLLRRGHFIERDAGEIARWAEDEMREAEADLEAHLAEVGAANWRKALARLADHHPSVDGYYRRFDELRDACRAEVERRRFLTWVDWPLRFVPQPSWAREAAPSLYFLPYRSPPAFDASTPHEYLVAPIDASTPADRAERILREQNDSVIKLNHVVHHGSVGHHFQNWHAYRAASRIGRVAAVDCASRIAFFCGGTMAEGWATYITQLLAETDLLTPLERFSARHGRLRAAARAFVDVRLHEGRLSLDDASRLYEDRVGMSAAAARSEAVKNSMFPGAALIYLVGSDLIRRLRERAAALQGSAFDLRAFHDRLLEQGSLPIALFTPEMLAPNPVPLHLRPAGA